MCDDREEVERETWFRLDCLVVRKKDQHKIIRDLSNRTLTDSHKLPHIELHGDHFLGEYPWHPSVSNLGDWRQPDSWYGLTAPVRATVGDYLRESGSYDYSIDDSIRLQLPAPWLAAALGIRLADGRQLNYIHESRSVVFYDPSSNGSGPQAALVDRDAFLRMLERESLVAIWIIAGEKSVYGGRDSFGGRRVHTAIYQLNEEGFTRQFHCERLHPSTEQLQALFAPENVPVGLTTRSAEPSRKASPHKKSMPRKRQRQRNGGQAPSSSVEPRNDPDEGSQC